MVLFYLAWPKAEHLPTMHRRSWRDLDFPGSFLLITAAVLVVFAFQSAGEDSVGNPWAKAMFIGPLVVGLISWLVLFVWEGALEHHWSHKMAALPLILIRNRVFAAATLSTIFLGFAYLATLYAVPLRLQVVNGKSPVMAGVMMLPMLGGTGIGSVLTGVLSKKQNRLFETMTVATIMVTLGLALETTVSDAAALEPKFLGFLVFIGLGYGMITSSATIFTTIEAPIMEHGKITPQHQAESPTKTDDYLISARTGHNRTVPHARGKYRHCHVISSPRRAAEVAACGDRLAVSAVELAKQRLQPDAGPVRCHPQDVQRLVHRDDESVRHHRWNWRSPYHGDVPPRQGAAARSEGTAGPRRDRAPAGGKGRCECGVSVLGLTVGLEEVGGQIIS